MSKISKKIDNLAQGGNREDQYALAAGDIIRDFPISIVRNVGIQMPKSNSFPGESATSSRIETSAEGLLLSEGGNAYEIIESLSSNQSYGYSYKARRLGTNDENDFYFIKTPKISAGIPYAEIEVALSEIFVSFVAEYQNKSKIEDLNRVEKVAAEIKGLGFYAVKGGKRLTIIPFLVQEFLDYANMEHFFLQYGATDDGIKPTYASDNKFHGITKPEQWFALAKDITELVRRVHNRDIVHGEIVPKNILLQEQEEAGRIKPILVDFGKSYQLDVLPASGTRLPQKPKTSYVAPECAGNMMWHVAADIYSLGGVLYYLATGEAPPNIFATDVLATPTDSANVRDQKIPKRKTTPKQGVSPKQTDVAVNPEKTNPTDAWKQIIHKGFIGNTELMKKNESIVKIIDKCMRPDPLERYSSAERVLQGIRAVHYRPASERATETLGISGALEDLSKQWGAFTSNRQVEHWEDLFPNIVADRLDILKNEMSSMSNGHFEIYGEREDLIDALVKYLGVLGQGDVYVTVTVPEYWTKFNLGINGRFLTANKDLVRNGVRVNRLFLITKDDYELKSEKRDVLKAHLDAWKSLDPKLQMEEYDFTAGNDSGGMFVGYCLFPTKEMARDIQSQVEHVAMWEQAKNSKKMSIHFSLRPSINGEGTEVGSQLVKIRFSELVDQAEAEFEYTRLKSLFTSLIEGVPRIKTLKELDQHLE